VVGLFQSDHLVLFTERIHINFMWYSFVVFFFWGKVHLYVVLKFVSFMIYLWNDAVDICFVPI
jgi:hypothetical protein